MDKKFDKSKLVEFFGRSDKTRTCDLQFPKTDFYVFPVLNSAFWCYFVNQSVHFCALVYYCFHVVHSALGSEMWSKLAPLKSTSGHLKIGQNIRTAVAAASRKRAEKKHNVVSPKAADRNMWSYRTKTAWSSHVVESL